MTNLHTVWLKSNKKTNLYFWIIIYATYLKVSKISILFRELININTHPELYQLAFGPGIDGGNEILFKFPIHLLKEGELVNFKVLHKYLILLKQWFLK